MAHDDIVARLRSLQTNGEVTAFSVSETEHGKPKIRLSWVGELDDKKRDLISFLNDYPETDQDPQKGDYYFFTYFFKDELRPGSGLIRVFGGKSEGPGGTLTCLLTSKDGQDIYFAAAGHVLTDFWRDTNGQGSIYRYRKGFPSTGSTRFLGKVLYLPKEDELPQPVPDRSFPGKYWLGASIDVGVVKLEVDLSNVELKQRTTCFGGFGEQSIKAEENMHVVKCGSQETHWTEAVVWDANKPEVLIYGPNSKQYLFRNQIILRDLYYHEAIHAECPKNSVDTPFAVPGDSGTIVVEKKTKRPVGMLIAGSVLDGRYVVTPFESLKQFFDKFMLVRQRA
jgi:hypothetical protein